jgi:hypothetical protein
MRKQLVRGLIFLVIAVAGAVGAASAAGAFAGPSPADNTNIIIWE